MIKSCYYILGNKGFYSLYRSPIMLLKTLKILVGFQTIEKQGKIKWVHF